ncbi:neuraminidase-like domain-containing protein [Vibrio owensii]|uniref:Tc toxin subunit A-related protein n=1 Tax=Vibrio owensii TaxID=696485 RepID=UPI003DA1C3BC
MFNSFKSGLNQQGYESITDISFDTFNVFRTKTKSIMSYQESKSLYDEAVKQSKSLKTKQLKVLRHAAPQLQTAMAAVKAGRELITPDYENLFGRRSAQYVPEGSVSSQFSPTAYLAELYREAKELHGEGMPEHIDVRRPDIGSLILSQATQDETLSTLSMANEVMKASIGEADIEKKLSEAQGPDGAAFHFPFERVQSVMEQKGLEAKEVFEVLGRSHWQESQAIYDLNLSPIQAEKIKKVFSAHNITDDEYTALLKQCYGTNEIGLLAEPTYLCDVLSINTDELNALLPSLASFSYIDEMNAQGGQSHMVFKDENGQLVQRKFTVSQFGNASQTLGIKFQATEEKDTIQISVASALSDSHGRFDVKIDGNVVYSIDEGEEIKGRYVTFTHKLKPGFSTFVVRLIRNGVSWQSHANIDFEPSKPIANSTMDKVSFSLTPEALCKLYYAVNLNKFASTSYSTMGGVLNSYLKSPRRSYITPLSVINTISKLIQVGLEPEDASVLVGLNIGAVQFERLFNQSIEEGVIFTIDESANSMSYDPLDTAFVQYRNVLKGALEVDDSELEILARISQEASDASRSLNNISALYRAHLMTRWLKISPVELELLLQAYPHSLQGTLWSESWYGTLRGVESLNEWVLNQKLSYPLLASMTAPVLIDKMPPQMEQFLGALSQSVEFDEAESQVEELVNQLSVEVASAFSIENQTLASLVLDWVDQIAPYNEELSLTSTATFWKELNKYNLDQKADIAGIVKFIQIVAQLSLVVNHLSITSDELKPLLYQNPTVLRGANTYSGKGLPDRFDRSLQNVLAPSVKTLRELSRLKETQKKVNDANLFMSYFVEGGTFDKTKVVELLTPEHTQSQVESAYEHFDNIASIGKIAELLELTKAQKLSVEALVAFTGVKESTAYEEWSALVNQFEASLSALQQTKHKNKVEESLSQALCGYFLANKAEVVTSFDLNDREDLYRYLLIDNKVSGEILTTQVAESIASLQLYVNKCIQGFEPNIDHELLLRPFFEHWSRYNNRYSTWAGLEKLTFYPENYVEPTLRYNQTRLQQALLSDISQNQLNDDTVDDAYRRYLNQFEEVANLDVLSGYLHGNDFHLGDTYFAARSKEKPHRYYWRSLDNTASDGMDGYVASAWSEWEEITTPMTPLRDQVRLVMFQDRLYISWIEAVESAEKDSSSDKIEPKTSYLLKLSYRKIDGTWAAALEYPLNMPSSLITTFNLYSTYHSETGSMLFMLYDPNKVPDWYDGIGNEGPAYSCVIGADLQFKEKAATDESWKDIYTNFKDNLNTGTVKNKVIRYVPDAYYEYESPLNLLSPSTNKDGIVSNVKIDEQYIDNDHIPPNFCCKTSFNVKAACSPSYKKTGGYMPSDLEITGISNVKVYPNKVELDIHHKDIWTDVWYRAEGGSYKSAPRSSWNNGKKRYVFHDALPEGSTSRRFVFDMYHYKPGGGKYRQVFDLRIQSSIGVNHWGQSRWKALPLYPSTQKLKHTFFYNLSGGELKTTPVLKVKKSGTTVYQQNLHIDVGTDAKVNPTDNMLIVNDSNGACYLEFTNKARRTRLNTLFAKELISRARYGLDNVLSWETQQLAEPKLGQGSYIDVTFPAYDPKQHGSGQFTVHTVGVNFNRSPAQALSGQLSEGAPTIVKVFLPYSEHRDSSAEENQAFIGITIKGTNLGGTSTWKKMDRYRWDAAKSSYRLAESDRHLNGASSQISETQTEPMDFSGANSLYFWELFYYTPMMVADRLLQSQAFESAERWLKYVFNPSGYFEKSLEGLEDTGRQWNMRPLQEDTAWDGDNIDTIDPDIVAQADPMHYKVATYMKLLDLLIARGDMAYRRLERDTLNEAKMWYSVAKNLLGETSVSASKPEWSELPLNVVADKEVHKSALKTLDLITKGQASQASYDERVKMLFYPTSNDKLTGYDKTLNQRLFNLRHNLSIDGQPLTLSIYAEPADPKALHRAAAASVNGGYAEMGQTSIAIQRFPIMLESARGLVNQLTHYGSTLLSVLEKKDAEGLSQLMQTHAVEVMDSTLDQQALMIDELKSEQSLLAVNLRRANASLETYQAWLKEGVSSAEKKAMDTRFGAGELTLSANAFRVAGAAIDATPNVFGLAFGGMQFGSLLHATAAGFDASSAWAIAQAEVLETSEQYRRRAQEWESARDDAKLAVKEIEQQQKTVAIRLEAAEMQASLLKTQKSQLNEQLDLLKTKFTNQSLYSWMQGKLATLYYQFYDLVVMRCLKAQLGYQWETQDTSTFIQPGAWDSHRAGLLCGEALMLNLTQMESAYLDWDSRSLEVNRTVSMSKEMGDIDFNAEVLGAMKGSDPSVSSKHSLQMKGKEVFEAKIDLKALNIEADYPNTVVGDNKVRRIKQVSVSLPALLSPYQDVQAVLSYSGNGDLIHQSCTQAAISHGVNDSGQFQLDFNDSRYLPFEGLPIDGDGSASLILTFPNAGDSGKQRALLESLTDIILHIRYTIGTSK